MRKVLLTLVCLGCLLAGERSKHAADQSRHHRGQAFRIESLFGQSVINPECRKAVNHGPRRKNERLCIS